MVWQPSPPITTKCHNCKSLQHKLESASILTNQQDLLHKCLNLFLSHRNNNCVLQSVKALKFLRKLLNIIFTTFFPSNWLRSSIKSCLLGLPSFTRDINGDVYVYLALYYPLTWSVNLFSLAQFKRSAASRRDWDWRSLTMVVQLQCNQFKCLR